MVYYSFDSRLCSCFKHLSRDGFGTFLEKKKAILALKASFFLVRQKNYKGGMDYVLRCFSSYPRRLKTNAAVSQTKTIFILRQDELKGLKKGGDQKRQNIISRYRTESGSGNRSRHGSMCRHRFGVRGGRL